MVAMDLSEADAVLREALRFLRDSGDARKGVVVACLRTPGLKVCAHSCRTEDGRYVHAERAAIEKYWEAAGEMPGKGALMAVSLSPCVRENPARVGLSCSDLLLGRDPAYPRLRIPRVHAGFLDPAQVTAGDYGLLGFDLTFPEDAGVARACGNLFRYFDPANYRKVDIPAFVSKALAGL